MTSSNFDFRTRIKNDTSNKVTFTVTKTISDVKTPIDLTGVAIEMKIRNPLSETYAKTFSIGTGLTMDDATNGIFSLNVFVVNIEAACYRYDIQFTFTDDSIKTYLYGKFNVNTDV